MGRLTVNEYKTKYGTVSSPVKLNVDVSNIKIKSTLADFDNDEDMYRIYLEMESIFDDYENRIESDLIAENNKRKK